MKTEIEEAIITADAKFKDWLTATEKDFTACSRAKKIIYNFT